MTSRNAEEEEEEEERNTTPPLPSHVGRLLEMT